MTYATVDQARKATRDPAGGDLVSRIEMALLKKAVVQAALVGQTGGPDSSERQIISRIVEGDMPASWVTMVLYLLDVAGQLAAPTDTQLDTQVGTIWTRLVLSRV